tara:strand:+ start:383 stop:1384 length:1002 start_codon:yes stop_codon:yes gene_type:complete
MKVGVYLNTTTGGVDYHKQIWVKAFAEGINKHNPDHSATLIEEHEPVTGYDYSFCFSYQGEMFRPTNKMSLLRRALQEKHVEDGKIFFMDSDVLISYQGSHASGRQLKKEETEQGLRYVRLPYSHVHHPKAKHFYKDNWRDRWESIARNKKITVKNYQNTGGPILLVCNRGKEGYGGGGKPAHQWAIETIEELSKYTERNFVVRFHKANVNDKSESVKKLTEWSSNDSRFNTGRITIHNPDRTYPDLIQSITDSYAVVTYASSAAAPAIIEGRYLFVTSPTCFFYNERAGELCDIESPNIINRDDFFKRYSYSHWNLLDLRSGDFWGHVKDEI